MYSRSEKASHLDTIRYEIDMLEFSLGRLRNRHAGWDKGDENTFIETFLLHYRNLLEFFAGNKHRDDDLSTTESRPWANRTLTPEEVAAIQAPAAKLIESRPDPNSELTLFEIISKYLQHCTTLRYERAQSWPLEKMYADLRPVIAAFQKSFLPNSREPMQFLLGGTDNSTTSMG